MMSKLSKKNQHYRLAPAALIWMTTSLVPTTALCNCGEFIKKVVVQSENAPASEKLVQIRVGCNDEQLQTECFGARDTVQHFQQAVVDFVDEIYIQPNLDLINALLVDDQIALDDYRTLRTILTHQFNTVAEAVAEVYPIDCASGLWTDTLYTVNDDEGDTRLERATTKRLPLHDFQRWSLDRIRNNAVCSSRALEDELLLLQADNRVQRNLTLAIKDNESVRVATTTRNYTTSNDTIEELLRTELAQNDRKGLTPYTQRLMEVILRERNDGVDIGGLGISSGRDFVAYILLRVLDEPPEIRLPAVELSTKAEFDQGRLGKEPVECFPLDTTVLVRLVSENNRNDEPVYTAKPLSELKLGDEVVTGIHSSNDSLEATFVETSPVIDFAHRMDDLASIFWTIEYYVDETATTHSIAASSNHNVVFGVRNPVTRNIDAHAQTFGKLEQHFRVQQQQKQQQQQQQQQVYLSKGDGTWLAVRNVRRTVQNGFVAPVTKAGVMLVVPSPKKNNTTVVTATSNSMLWNQTDLLARGWGASGVVVSCFSTVPDGLANLVYSIKRIVWGVEDNRHGSGSGPFFNAISRLALTWATWMGHVTLSS